MNKITVIPVPVASNDNEGLYIMVDARTRKSRGPRNTMTKCAGVDINMY